MQMLLATSFISLLALLVYGGLICVWPKEVDEAAKKKKDDDFGTLHLPDPPGPPRPLLPSLLLACVAHPSGLWIDTRTLRSLTVSSVRYARSQRTLKSGRSSRARSGRCCRWRRSTK